MDDCIRRQAAIEVVDSEIVSTNPEHFKSSEKFIKFMDDADIASFGKWQWANGFNTAVVASKIQLQKLPSAEPETCAYWDRESNFCALHRPSAEPVIRCKDCKHLFEDNKCPLRTWWTHTEDDFCSYAERREE